MMRRQPRAQITLQRLDRIVGIGPGEVEEHRRHPVEHPLRPLHRLDGIGKVRLGRIGRDRIDIAARLRQRRLEGRREIGGPDRLERR